MLERRVRAASTAGAESFTGFLDRIAARTPTPGGGSAAAAAGALAAALGEMVLAYSVSAKSPSPELDASRAMCARARSEFVRAMKDDAAAYEAVRAARRALRDGPEDAARQRGYRDALRLAAEVPLATARSSVALSIELTRVGPRTRTALSSDLTTAIALLGAARAGALANVQINLVDLQAAGESVDEFAAEAERLRSA
ncbi:MAG: cyclodeaminase/cyclohydrolase family protein [Thermoplasmata archaeon]